MTTLEILKAARKLVAKPNGWIKGRFGAQKVKGKIVKEAADSHATEVLSGLNCFCAVGAVHRVSKNVDEALDLLGQFVPLREFSAASDIIAWNDKRWRTQAQVVKLFDKAITAEKSRLARAAA